MKTMFKVIPFCMLIFCTPILAQMDAYDYKNEIEGITDQWHSITIEDEIFAKTKKDLSDIRIYAITENHDTLETPYLLRSEKENNTNRLISFKQINKSNNANGYYYTFEIPTEESINQLHLQFREENFDWKTKLEGSMDGKEWFTILDQYRILSIKNKRTHFQFTTLEFEDSKFQFLRLNVQSQIKPQLYKTSISMVEKDPAIYKEKEIKSFDKTENAQLKQTQIDIALKSEAPISRIQLEVKNDYDYYRPITIKYLLDSIQTKKGWKYNYRSLTTGTLNSLDDHSFNFKSTTLKKIRIIIHNYDNQPLNIAAVQASGYTHQLWVRFTKQAKYFLVYGNQKAKRAIYDIQKFENNIPKNLSVLKLGKTVANPYKSVEEQKPLFNNNKMWLWGILISIILILGWFTLKMMQKQS